MNPFESSSEPDWVALPKLLQHMNTNNQDPNIRGPIQGQPYNPSIQNTSDRDSPISINKSTVTIRKPEDVKRRASSPTILPSSSKVTQKSRPPIPRKPSVLISQKDRRIHSNQDLSSTPSKSTSRADMGKSKPLKPASLSNDSNIPFVPAGKVFRSPAPVNHMEDLTSSAQLNATPLLPRRPTASQPSLPEIMDKKDEGAQAIPSLKPLRRN